MSNPKRDLALALMNQLLGAAQTSPYSMHGKRVITLDAEWVASAAAAVTEALKEKLEEG